MLATMEPNNKTMNKKIDSRRPVVLALAVLFMLPLVAGCRPKTSDDGNADKSVKNSNRVVAASYALQYLTERIVRDRIEVDFPASSAPYPREWSPTVEQIAAIQKADLVVVNGPGAPYANWLVRVTLPESKICRSCENLELRDFVTVKDYQLVHSHGPEGEHSHPYFVPYPWLSPRIAAKQAAEIKNALSRIYPEHVEEFDKNFSVLDKELSTLVANQKAIAAEQQNKVFATANPHLKFLTRFVGAEDHHLLWFSPEDVDSVAVEVQKLETIVAKHSPSHFLHSEEIPAELGPAVADSALPIIKIDTLDKKPIVGDFLSVIKKNIESVSITKE